MDPSLLRETESFKKRALAMPTVEVIKKKESRSAPPPKKKIKTIQNSILAKHKSSDAFSYKSKTAGSQNNFSILAKIVNHMKKRHQDGDTHPLKLEEILDETNQLDISARQKHWLETESLCGNPKVQVTPEKTYFFKPAYNLKNHKSLRSLLDKHDTRGYGGVLLEDVVESLPNTERILKYLGDQVTIIQRTNDKKKVLFFNDKTIEFSVDEPILKLWRSVAVEGIDEEKMEDYLTKEGINQMKEFERVKKAPMQKRKKSTQKKSRAVNRDNKHLADILESYT